MRLSKFRQKSKCGDLYEKILFFLGLFFLILMGCEQSSDQGWGKIEVKQGDFEIFVEKEGDLHALKTSIITSNIRGKISWLIDEGELVKKGNEVAVLEKEELEDELERINEDMKLAQEYLEELENSFADEKKELESNLDKYSTNMKIAKLQRKKLEDGPSELEKKRIYICTQAKRSALGKCKAQMGKGKSHFCQKHIRIHQTRILLEKEYL